MLTEGFEPSRYCYQRILSPVCLPIPPCQQKTCRTHTIKLHKFCHYENKSTKVIQQSKGGEKIMTRFLINNLTTGIEPCFSISGCVAIYTTIRNLMWLICRCKQTSHYIKAEDQMLLIASATASYLSL